MAQPLRKYDDERSPERKKDLEAQLDELGTDPREVGSESAGQSGVPQRLSIVEDASDESVDELEEEGQNLEAASLEGDEDAAGHPERPTHTHKEYGDPGDIPPRRRDDVPR